MRTLLEQDPLNYGYVLENKLLKELKDIHIFDQIIVEETLRKKWGWEAAGVDQLLYIGDYVIPIQVKWRCTRRREDLCIHNYLKSLDFVLDKSGKKLLFGLWVSRLEPFADNKEKLQKKGVYSISCFESMDVLVKDAKKLIINLLKP